jgi:hypothetical protein
VIAASAAFADSPATPASPAPSAAAPAAPPAATQPAASRLTPRQVLENFERSAAGQPPAEIDPNAPPEEDLGDDPLATVADKMTNVEGDLNQLKTDKPVQEKEKNIVDDLNQLIAKLEPPGGGDGNSNGGNIPGTGRKKSVIVSGDPTGGELHGIDPRAHQWTDLPPKQRDQILQSRTEGFPPGYEALLQSYYQRLAQEKPADDKPAAPARP